jgi:hypothetical protein
VSNDGAGLLGSVVVGVRDLNGCAQFHCVHLVKFGNWRARLDCARLQARGAVLWPGGYYPPNWHGSCTPRLEKTAVSPPRVEGVGGLVPAVRLSPDRALLMVPFVAVQPSPDRALLMYSCG